MVANMEQGAVRSIIYKDGLNPAELSKLMGPDKAPFADIKVQENSPHNLIREAIIAMSRKALELWPDWYVEKTIHNPFDGLFSYDKNTLDMFLVIQKAERIREADPHWLKNAITEGVFQGKSPYFEDYPYQIQARQLSLVIRHKYDTLRIILESHIAKHKGNLSGLSKATEWLGREMGFTVEVFIPDSLKDDQSLSSLLYKAGNLEEGSISSPPPEVSEEELILKTQSPEDLPPYVAKEEYGHEEESEDEGEETGAARFAGAPYVLEEGKPNPESQGELLLADHISKSDILRPLFTYNTPIITKEGTRVVVDLLWEAGKLVVEVDGFHYHGSRVSFKNDRHRDYLLMISGYRVLRLANSEIKHSVSDAGRKILNVVNYIKDIQERA
jgi:hypothetical protein